MKIRKIPLLTLAPLMLSSCSTYVSSYKAFMLVRSNTNEHSYVSFDELEGTLVFKMKKKTPGEGDIVFNASLGEGKVTVTYDIYNVQSNLFVINGGEIISNHFGYVESSHRVYIILKTEGKCLDGKFDFTFSN